MVEDSYCACSGAAITVYGVVCILGARLETLEEHYDTFDTLVFIDCKDWKFVYLQLLRMFPLMTQFENLRILDSSKIIQCGTSIRQF